MAKMGRPKKVREDLNEEIDSLKEIEEALVETGVESHPDFDPDLPENKQRGLR